jgi:hypothetical protein
MEIAHSSLRREMLQRLAGEAHPREGSGQACGLSITSMGASAMFC